MAEVTAQDRRSQILVEAERLFAERGVEAVSMRDIAKSAGVSVALLTYHFATKENLYHAVFDRHREVLEQRLARLNEIDLEDPEALEQVIAAFVEPQMQLRESAQGLDFARLVAREAADPSSEARGIIEEFYDPMAQEFITAMQSALPEVPAERIRWGYLFAVGAMSMSVFDQRVERLGGDPAMPLEDKTTMLKDFITGGLAGPPSSRASSA